MAKIKDQKPPKWLIFIGIFIVLLVLLWKPYWNNLNNQNLKGSQNETANWKTYTDQYGYYTISYPSNWTVTYSEPDNNIYAKATKGRSSIAFGGPQGSVQVWWLETYGGGCDPENHAKIKVGNEEQDTCHSFDQQKHMELWSIIQKELDPNTHLGIQIEAMAISSNKTNRNVILKILSSFKFTN